MSASWSKISMTVHDFNLAEPVYTVQEAAELLDCSIQTLNRWHRNGIFISHIIVRNNRTYRYYDNQLLGLIKNSDVYKKLPKNLNSDLIHSRFNKLFVISFSEEAISKGYYGSYNCLCDCGNIITLSRSELLSGKYKSCGCRYTDLSGQTFGKWHVNHFAGKYISPKGDTCLQYDCTCCCGERRIVLAQSLLTGRSYSCGCTKPSGTMSKAEACVVRYLQSINMVKDVDYYQYKTFPDLLGLGGGKLSYDFYIKKDGIEYLIECQGGQHYFPIELWGGEDAFLKQKKHDEIKAKYAEIHNKQLIEIPYTMFTYDQIEMLLDAKLPSRWIKSSRATQVI